MKTSTTVKTGLISLVAYGALAATAVGSAGLANATPAIMAAPATSIVAQVAQLLDNPDYIQPARGVHPIALTGSFEGRSDHETRGTATIVKTEAGYELRLSSDFYLDGAPGPVVGFGQGGEYIEASELGDLQRKRGSQTYPLPADFIPANYSEVFVWCEDFSVPLGVASLTPA
jgi:hypothetical protein